MRGWSRRIFFDMKKYTGKQGIVKKVSQSFSIQKGLSTIYIELLKCERRRREPKITIDYNKFSTIY